MRSPTPNGERFHALSQRGAAAPVRAAAGWAKFWPGGQGGKQTLPFKSAMLGARRKDLVQLR